MPILLILNLIALLFMMVLLWALDNRARIFFSVGAFIPVLIIAIITVISQPDFTFGIKEMLLFLLRGGLILAIASGSLTCFIAARFQPRNKRGT